MDQTSPNSSNSQPEATVGVSFFSMFRFADKTDVLLMVLGTCGAIGLGAFTPLFVLFWGDMTNAFGSANDQIVDMAWQVLKKFIYLGCGGFLSGWLMITCWLISGERQASRCRKTYFAHLLKQEIGWFDCINQAELSSKFTSDTQCFQGAIG